MTRKNKPTHQIILKLNLTDEQKLEVSDEEKIDLYVVENYEYSTRQTIIVNESATGNGGITYSNGRTQEIMPISGTLLGETHGKVTASKDVHDQAERLRVLADSGAVVELNGFIGSNTRTNKFFIEEVRFTQGPGVDDQLPFSMTLTEYRDANVKDAQVNLITFDIADTYKKEYQTLIAGNLS